jgi:hypothetical protein
MLPKHSKTYSVLKIIKITRNKTKLWTIMPICSFKKKDIKIHTLKDITEDKSKWMTRNITVFKRLLHLTKMQNRIKWICKFNKTTAKINYKFLLNFKTYGITKKKIKIKISTPAPLAHLLLTTTTTKIHIAISILLMMITNNTMI